MRSVSGFVKRDLNLKVPLTVKLGADLRSQHRDIKNTLPCVQTNVILGFPGRAAASPSTTWQFPEHSVAPPARRMWNFRANTINPASIS